MYNLFAKLRQLKKLENVFARNAKTKTKRKALSKQSLQNYGYYSNVLLTILIIINMNFFVK